jgi:competence protein ComEC
MTAMTENNCTRTRINQCSQLLWAFFVGVPTGVAVVSWWRESGIEWLLVALACGVVAVWSHVFQSWRVALLLVGVAVGMGHTESVFRERTGWQGSFQEYSVRSEVRVAGEWSRNSFSASVPITWNNCDTKNCPTMKSLLQMPLEEAWLPGDILSVACKLTLPKNISPDFDYRIYLAKENIGTICIPTTPPQLLNQSSLETLLFRVKQSLERSLVRSVPEPESGFLAGLIFGGSQRLPQAIQDDFKKTGVSHIVAVSGYNVLIVAECLLLLGIAIGLWRRQATWCALVGIWLFAIMTGAGASVVRAATMASIVLLATQSGRLVAPWRLITLMLVLLLWINPLLLRYDIGFQLSVIATAVLLFVMLRDTETGNHSRWTLLRELIGATALIELFVAPILLLQFGFVSTVSLYHP